jgi:hypothetical protein
MSAVGLSCGGLIGLPRSRCPYRGCGRCAGRLSGRQLRGLPGGASPHEVDTVALGVLVFADDAFVQIDGVGVAAAGHGDVKQCAGGVFAENYVDGVSGDTLCAVHGDGIAMSDVLAQVLAGESGAGAIGEAAGSNAIVVRVDGVDAPAVSVAHRVGLIDDLVSEPTVTNVRSRCRVG